MVLLTLVDWERWGAELLYPRREVFRSRVAGETEVVVAMEELSNRMNREPASCRDQRRTPVNITDTYD